MSSASSPELALARDAVASLAETAVIGAEDCPRETCPACVVLAGDRAGAWTLPDVLRLARRWPLAPIVAVTATLGDGRRRSGPPLPGIEEIPWHDLPGRLATWFTDVDSGRAGSVTPPGTARREDRLLDAPLFRPSSDRDRGRAAVAIAARDRVTLEGVADLLAAIGHAASHRHLGRPPVDCPASTLVWDVGELTADALEWLRLIVANGSGVGVVLLDSFPRHETAAAALRSGAAAVLGRPVVLEALAGTIDRILRGRRQAVPSGGTLLWDR